MNGTICFQIPQVLKLKAFEAISSLSGWNPQEDLNLSIIIARLAFREISQAVAGAGLLAEERLCALQVA